MAIGVDSTKTAARPSHEAIESTGGNATSIGETAQQKIDHVAMESAKRAQNRVHSNETQIPGSSVISK
jgi:hypothetical protein